jgi:FixJ family two-component response regulator
MDSPTVYLIDDDASYLRAAARLLRLSGFQVKAYRSAADFLTELDPDAVGCIITDLDMPDMNGVDLQKYLSDHKSLLPVIFLSGKGDIPTSVHVMRHGAEDFLTKDAPKDDLITAVHRAFRRNEVERQEEARIAELRDRMATLSPREYEVLQHVVQGKLNKQIAADLGIHERTVKLHRTAITTKLGVRSVAELTMIWMKTQGAASSSENE